MKWTVVKTAEHRLRTFTSPFTEHTNRNKNLIQLIIRAGGYILVEGPSTQTKSCQNSIKSKFSCFLGWCARLFDPLSGIPQFESAYKYGPGIVAVLSLLVSLMFSVLNNVNNASGSSLWLLSLVFGFFAQCSMLVYSYRGARDTTEAGGLLEALEDVSDLHDSLAQKEEQQKTAIEHLRTNFRGVFTGYLASVYTALNCGEAEIVTLFLDRGDHYRRVCWHSDDVGKRRNAKVLRRECDEWNAMLRSAKNVKRGKAFTIRELPPREQRTKAKQLPTESEIVSVEQYEEEFCRKVKNKRGQGVFKNDEFHQGTRSCASFYFGNSCDQEGSAKGVILVESDNDQLPGGTSNCERIIESHDYGDLQATLAALRELVPSVDKLERLLDRLPEESNG